MSNRFEELGIPLKLIELYKKEPPFYFLQQDVSNIQAEQKEYRSLFKFDHQRQFEGVVGKNGEPAGNGTFIMHLDDTIGIIEGTLENGGGFTGLGRNFLYVKKTEEV